MKKIDINRHEKCVNELRSRKFKDLDEKSNALRDYIEKFTNKDIRHAIFIELQPDEYRFPTLERSISRGLIYQSIINEWIESESGLVPRWYAENQSS